MTARVAPCRLGTPLRLFLSAATLTPLATGTGVARLVVVPSPSWPTALMPQQ
jgi:hypothetical protein